jgi:hypothetical protein
MARENQNTKSIPLLNQFLIIADYHLIGLWEITRSLRGWREDGLPSIQ